MLEAWNFACRLGLPYNHRKNCQNPKFPSRGGARGPLSRHRFNMGNMVWSTSRYRRSVKFGILIGIALKLDREIRKPKNSVQGRIQGPLIRREKYGLRYRRSVKFGILRGIALQLNGKIRKPKNSVQWRIQGPLTPGEIWSKVLPGIVEAWIRYIDWDCPETKRENSKTQKFCPGAPDAGRNSLKHFPVS